MRTRVFKRSRGLIILKVLSIFLARKPKQDFENPFHWDISFLEITKKLRKSQSFVQVNNYPRKVAT